MLGVDFSLCSSSFGFRLEVFLQEEVEVGGMVACFPVGRSSISVTNDAVAALPAILDWCSGESRLPIIKCGAWRVNGFGWCDRLGRLKRRRACLKNRRRTEFRCAAAAGQTNTHRVRKSAKPTLR